MISKILDGLLLGLLVILGLFMHLVILLGYILGFSVGVFLIFGVTSLVVAASLDIFISTIIILLCFLIGSFIIAFLLGNIFG